MLPLMVLAWMGLRLLSSEQIVIEHQQQQLATAQLTTAQASIHSFFESLQRDSVDALSFLDVTDGVDERDTQLIRSLIESDPYLEQIFVLNAQRDAIFPLSNSSASNKEQEFLASSLDMFLDDKLFRSTNHNETLARVASDEQVVASRDTSKRGRNSGLFDFARSPQPRSQESYEVLESYGATDQANVVRETGWSTWDAGAETQIYFWFKDAQQNLVGQKLSASYWLAQLISQLPDDTQAQQQLGSATIRLIDKRQRTIYQWGGFNLDQSINDNDNDNAKAQTQIAEDATAQAQMWLGHPLDGWRLEYFSPPSNNDFGSRALLFVALLLTLSILMVAVGWLIWRAYQREMRLAEQRVSFVNQVSHELKTPLTNICMYADLLEDEVVQTQSPDRSRVKKFSDVLTSESQRLARLINNVLNFSKAQEQQINLATSPNVVDQLIQQSLRTFEAAFAAKEITVELQLNADKQVMVDAQIVEQVLNNLLGNIEKYASSGKLARIASSYADGVTRIEVTDAGPGISRKMHTKIFEPFVRGSQALTEGASGTGIGLSIAQQLCQLHGGDLTLKESTSLGSTFVVRINTPKVTDSPGQLEEHAQEDKLQ